MGAINSHTTIGLKKNTKARLDKSRATGQCYDGFLCELVGLWERTHNVSNRHQTNTVRHKVSSDVGA